MHDEHFETGIMIEMSVAGGDDQAMMFVLKLGQFLGDAVRVMIVDETTMPSGEAVCSPTSRSRIRSRKGNLFGFKIGLGHYEPIITCRKSGNDKGAACVCLCRPLRCAVRAPKLHRSSSNHSAGRVSDRS